MKMSMLFFKNGKELPNITQFSAGAPDSATVDSGASTQIVAANYLRKYLAITNASAVDVYISIGTPAILNKGVLLKANGGSIVFGGQTLVTGAVNGIAASATANITFMEGT
jgi:hypothetical protein